MKKKNSLIVGAGVAGRLLVKELKRYPHLPYKVIGFIDDTVTKTSTQLNNLPILGTLETLEEIIAKKNIDSVFIAIPSGKGSLVRTIIDRCKKVKVEFRIIPRMVEIIRGKVHLDFIRNVDIEDVLGREIRKSDQSLLAELFHNKRVLITGAAGSIGSELARQITELEPQSVIYFDWWENGLFELEHELKNKGSGTKEFVIGNIQDKNKLEYVFKKYRPHFVFHAAAFKHVPLMQQHPEEAVKNNIIGTNNCAEIASKYKAEKFILISTDKAVNPTNVMGATKSLAEALVMYHGKKSQTKFIAVRFGNVIGSNGSVFPLFKKQIARGGPVTVTHPEMTRYFMTIPEAVQLILFAGKMGKGEEVYVLDMGEQVKIIDLARTMIRLSGYEPGKDIKIEIIGNRGGEKMYEELWTSDEALEKTQHNLIYETKKIMDLSDQKLQTVYKTLTTAAVTQNQKAIMKQLTTLYPMLHHIKD